MTREKAKEAAKVILAYAEGKDIEYRNYGNCAWKTISAKIDEVAEFNWGSYDYRIKPEPKYRPFATKEECWEEMHKHSDFGWVIYDKKYYSICDVTSNEITILYECDPCCLDFKSCIEKVTFTDGIPFGIKED